MVAETIQVVTASMPREVIVTVIGPSGDSEAVSHIAILPASAACLLRKNQVESFCMFPKRQRLYVPCDCLA